jgi:glucans biosynthesis protein C
MSVPAPKVRLDYIDNLRSTMIFLVLGIHTAVTYGHIGMWYYSEPGSVNGPSQLVFMTFMCNIQAFFMGFLFLLAGYFTPGAYDRKGFWRFLWDRFVRLGLPSILYVLLLHPLTAWLGMYLHKLTVAELFRRYFTEGAWVDGAGPMWFAVSLLVFSVLYALFRSVAARPRPHSPAAKVKLLWLLGLGLVITAIAYLIRMQWWIGTHFHTFQFGFFAQYVVLFAVGIAAFRQQWFAAISKRLGTSLLIGAVVLGPLAFWGLLFFGGLFQNGFHAFEGHGTWLSGGYALWESLFCVAMCAGLLLLYREFFNAKRWLGRLLAENSFAIYVIHPPVLVGICLLLAPLAWPPLAKWLLVWPLAFVATLAVSHLLVRRIPLLKKIL